MHIIDWFLWMFTSHLIYMATLTILNLDLWSIKKDQIY